jgi:hydrogenase maturation protein HypF
MTACQIRVRGLVQGVGFRPYVWRLANELGLNGWVRNDGAGVTVAVDGEKVPEFLARLPQELPRLARIDAIEHEAYMVDGTGFSIIDSVAGAVATSIGPDAALCHDCIVDLCNPQNRRWRYPFTTCTHCGPRYTVSRKIPYDRVHTSLAPFALCTPCAAEYSTPADRRFHAETTCCPDCGPQLRLLGANGETISGDPFTETLRLLRAGKIVALKGLGGFHLACDARNLQAVGELRQRKQREEKPFAVMALNPASLAAYATIGPADTELLNSAAAPVVLCAKGVEKLPGIAPGLAEIGVMVPSTPLHLLLWHEAVGRPAGTDWLREPHEMLLVMTSANPHGEPLVIGNDEALARLSGIADAYLLHDREIVVRCDDSVVRNGPAFVRRARGYVPLPVVLNKKGPNVLALGGYLKNTICVMKGKEAFLSQHIGGLENAAAIAFLEESVAHLLAILDVTPDLIAHDLHPDYPSTHLALRLAGELGIPVLAVGHHHAHIAAICAEHGVKELIIGLAMDGVGLGADGGAWGGELLRVDGANCQRLGHLPPLKLPGGDRAAREPWRMAVSVMQGMGLGHRIAGWQQKHYPGRDAGPLLTMLARNLRCPPTTSMGRLFDAAAGLLGLRAEAHFEGQAAMELEGLAAGHGRVAPMAGGMVLTANGPDFSPLLAVLLDCDDAAYGAALFHATLAAGLGKWINVAVDREKLTKIAIGGGCAMNRVLMSALAEMLAGSGVTLLQAQQVPANDGGLALGQAWVTRCAWKNGFFENVADHAA